MLRSPVADRLELVLEVLAAGGGRVEVRLDHLRRGTEALERGRGGRGASTRASSPCRCRGGRRGRGACGADSSLQSEGRRVRKSRGVGTVADQGEQNARIRDTPSSASRIGDGEPESRRPQARNAGKRQKRTWHALQQADVEVHFVPLDGHALDALERERGGRLPVLRAAQDQVVERVADAVVLAVERVREVVCAEGRRAVSTQTAANFSRRQIETRRAQVAAWCSEYCGAERRGRQNFARAVAGLY